MLHHADYVIEFSGEVDSGNRRLEGAVKNVMTAVAHERLPVGFSAQGRFGAEGRQPLRGSLPAERNHVYGHGKLRGKMVDQLAIVAADPQPLSGTSYNLFAQQSPAVPFDEIQSAVFDFIRAVDRKVDLRLCGKAGEWNSQGSRFGRGTLGRWNTNDMQPLPHSSAKRTDGKRGGGSGSQPDNHSIRHQCRRRFSGCDFQGIVGKVHICIVARDRDHGYVAARSLACPLLCRRFGLLRASELESPSLLALNPEVG